MAARLRLLVDRKLGRCPRCLRLSVIGAVLAWLLAVGGFAVSEPLGWLLVVAAVAFTALAITHFVVLAARAGVGGAVRGLAAAFRLGCECDKIPVGYGLDRWYATKDDCEQTGIPGAYREGTDRARRFCDKHYECVDKDCPDKEWVNPTAISDCVCKQAKDGRWQAICDLISKTECCCRPQL